MTQVVRSEFILGGQKSGKSRRAEALAQNWLASGPPHTAILIATAQAFDDELRARIERHRQDRLLRVPGMVTIEEPFALFAAITQHSAPNTLIVVDCLTLWLTAQLMPPVSDPPQTGLATDSPAALVAWQTLATELCTAIKHAQGPIILVGNEIGLGVIPLGKDVRAFVDALGLLNQSVAAVCERVTLMSAGLPLALKGTL
jgi:adenosylcobinamide kinase/adenosylcobinamide-phosphate guanylyltransferase